MKTNLAPSSLKEISMASLKTGDLIINLGEVLEIDEQVNIYSIVVFRNNQKQVFTFSKTDQLLVRQKTV